MVSKFSGEPRVVNIRPAIAADREAIAKLEKVALTQGGAAQFVEQQWLLPGATVEVAAIVLIAEADVVPVGYVTGIVVNEGSWIRGYVCDLYVEDKYRRKRAAVNMMDEIILKMRELGARVFFTNSIKNNITLLRLSEKSNFAKLSAQEFYRLVAPEQKTEQEGVI